MGKCEYCGNEYEAKRSTSKYCGPKCRKLAFQNGNAKNAKDDEAGTLTEDEYIEPCMRPGYVCPTPEDQRKSHINYGPYMTAQELATAGLKLNRVSVPGDEDYDGVCSEPIWPVGGQVIDNVAAKTLAEDSNWKDTA